MVENVILLTVDALSASHVGYLGYDRPTTPNLDRFAEKGTTYDTCIAQSSHTRESMPALFYSQYPFEIGEVGPVPDDRPTLATVLQQAGFKTAGFHSNPYLSRAFGFDRGFDTFEDSLPLAKNRLLTHLHRLVNYYRLQPYTPASEVNDWGHEWLAEGGDQRSLLWLHYMDPHGPYQPPSRHLEQFSNESVGKRRAKSLWRRSVDDPNTLNDEEQQLLVDLYDAEIRYTDEMLGQFVDRLERIGKLYESLVVIAADHGDLFGKDGTYGHPRRLDEELIHVPLLFLGDGVPAGQLVDRVVENIDIAPTALKIAGVSIPHSFRGTPLPEVLGTPDSRDTACGVEEPPADEVAFGIAEAHGEDGAPNEFAIRSDRYKCRMEVDESGTVLGQAVYDLARDPLERDEIGGIESDRVAELTDVLRDHIDEVTTEGGTFDGDDIDEVVEDRLRDLGYR